MPDDLYKLTYNPDVLSCLANLSNDEVFTPPSIVNQILDMLPAELWHDKNTKFLDPACKSGVFLREIAKRLLTGLEEQIPDLQERIDHIFRNQLYGIAITELTSLLSRRSLYCSKYPNSKYSVTQFEDTSGNIRFKKIKHRWVNGRCAFCGASQSEYDRDESLETHAYEFLHTVKSKEIWNMKFDVIIGNPPYQLSTGGSKAQATPLYNKFVEQALKLNPRYLSMIIPDRWFAGGFGLNEFRRIMLNDRRITKLIDYPLASDCFPGVDIPGGICYFLWSRDVQDDCEVIVNYEGKTSTLKRPLLEPKRDVFIKYNQAVDIIHKISKFNEKTFDTLVSSQRPFGLPTNFDGNPISLKNDDLQVYGRNKSLYYIGKTSVKNELVESWKIFISRAYGERIPSNLFVLGKPFIGAPNTICTETYIAIGPFKTKKVAENVKTYIHTKFFRFLVLLHKPTQDTLRNVYSFVPIQDFSKPWIDEVLYAKYGLNKEEVAFIESMIRPMESTNDEDNGS